MQSQVVLQGKSQKGRLERNTNAGLAFSEIPLIIRLSDLALYTALIIKLMKPSLAKYLLSASMIPES